MARKTISIYRVNLIKVGRFVKEDHVVKGPSDAASIAEAFLLEHCGGYMPDREYFGAVWLNTKNKPTGAEIVSIGGLDFAVAIPREIFKGAILHNAASLFIFHNHPSGNASPSPEDIKITKRIAEAGTLIGIDLLDHIILGENRTSVSLKEMGIM